MNKNLLALVLCLLLVVSTAWASSIVDITQIGMGARPLGMGKCSVALVSDTSAVFLNPAGLSDINQFNVLTMNSRVLQEVNYLTMALSYPVLGGVAALGYVSAQVPSVALSSINAYGTPENTGEFANYGEQALVLSYGVDFKDIFNNDFLKRMKFGANIKYFLQDFSGGSASLEGANGSGLDMDIGLQYVLDDWMNFGCTVQNLLPTSLGGKFSWTGSGLVESIPSVFKVGLGMRVWGENAPFQVQAQELYLACDTDLYYTEGRPNLWHVGLEWWPVEILALRAGIDQKDNLEGSVWRPSNNLTAGVGLRYGGFTFDYAYNQIGTLNENVTHFFSIGFVGEEKIEALSPYGQKRRRRPVLFTEILPEPAVKTFQDVPEDYWARRPIEYLATLQIFGGFPDGTFKPESPINRAELAVLLVNAKELPLVRPTSPMFVDVPSGHWAEKHIAAAVERGYISGYPSGKFNPYKEVSRAEGIVILAKFAGLIVPSKVYERPFPDIPKGHWAAEEIYAAKEAGMLEYLGGKNFEPEKKLTRAEVAEIISKTRFGKEKIKEFLLFRQ